MADKPFIEETGCPPKSEAPLSLIGGCDFQEANRDHAGSAAISVSSSSSASVSAPTVRKREETSGSKPSPEDSALKREPSTRMIMPPVPMGTNPSGSEPVGLSTPPPPVGTSAGFSVGVSVGCSVGVPAGSSLGAGTGVSVSGAAMLEMSNEPTYSSV